MVILAGESKTGWDKGDRLADKATQNFPGITKSQWRTTFVRSAVKLVEEVGLDGYVSSLPKDR